MQQQLQSNWCWAAVTCSTSAYYLANTPWGQCTLVNAALGQTGCCANGSSAPCNQPWYLDRALQRTGNLGSRASGPVAWEKIRGEIDAGRPVGARIGWSGGGGHFVLLTGYRSAGSVREVEVQDPFTGRSALPLDQFRTRYKSTGTWTHTYLTRR
jgi:papain like cysteine protease AvrRpt2